MKNLKLHTPGGLSDLLPQSYQFKRAAERQFETVFERYGYTFVSSPTLEYLAVFEGKGSIPVTEIYKLGDRNGDMLAVRPDMTPAVARLTMTHKLLAGSDPFRICYIEKAFRNHAHLQGRENEFTQAGAELIGVASPEADAELIALAIQGLQAAGLEKFRIDIGQVDFLPGILAELEAALSDEERHAFMDHMIRRDYVAAEALAVKAKAVLSGGPQMPAAILLSDLTKLTGGVDMLRQVQFMAANPQAKEALRHLEAVYAILQDQGLSDHVLLDLSMTGQLDYYTGVIFKGYAKGSGSTVVDGGRYDNLLATFNGDEAPIPAVGFGIKIEGLLEALTAQGMILEDEATDTLLAYDKSARAVALTTGDVMRKQGLHLENSLVIGSLEFHKAYALRKNMKGVIYFADEDTVLLVNLETGHEQRVTVEELKGL
ncbi:MAG: ATP phosphoribosyltransferase regulatory subunit [Defluviitaleaceae bacterium]|nr:ATP phosphoribosyltransferase regulatory subunit [Defluviitaleaceae bacterium]